MKDPAIRDAEARLEEALKLGDPHAIEDAYRFLRALTALRERRSVALQKRAQRRGTLLLALLAFTTAVLLAWLPVSILVPFPFSAEIKTREARVRLLEDWAWEDPAATVTIVSPEYIAKGCSLEPLAQAEKRSSQRLYSSTEKAYLRELHVARGGWLSFVSRAEDTLELSVDGVEKMGIEIMSVDSVRSNRVDDWVEVRSNGSATTSGFVVLHVRDLDLRGISIDSLVTHQTIRNPIHGDRTASFINGGNIDPSWKEDTLTLFAGQTLRIDGLAARVHRLNSESSGLGLQLVGTANDARVVFPEATATPSILEVLMNSVPQGVLVAGILFLWTVYRTIATRWRELA